MKRFSAAFLILMCVLCLTACREGRGDVTAKPVIYLYPEEETQVTVKLDYAGELTCTYPAYDDGWTVTAQPDGTLTDAAGQTYSYLFWEPIRQNHSKPGKITGKSRKNEAVKGE